MFHSTISSSPSTPIGVADPRTGTKEQPITPTTITGRSPNMMSGKPKANSAIKTASETSPPTRPGTPPPGCAVRGLSTPPQTARQQPHLHLTYHHTPPLQRPHWTLSHLLPTQPIITYLHHKGLLPPQLTHCTTNKKAPGLVFQKQQTSPGAGGFKHL
ncbi:unnamed protein product [Pleuronectes platessa]|uniref:Uncharacterized protein n=1 Tax=Pleuronectes platessa TaxID=8262 RepID=A0A9N7U959_PLEPL|nr:unnamed protein product [Pleuronectes platessa]